MNTIVALPPVKAQTRVNAPPSRAFEVFTSGMGRWWNPSHSINKSPLKAVVMEPHVGGRWYEVGEERFRVRMGPGPPLAAARPAPSRLAEQPPMDP